MSYTQQKPLMIVSILLIISIFCNIFLVFSYSNKLKTITTENNLTEIIEAISASDNTLEVCKFYKEQLNMNLINSNDFSASYKELIDIHEQLIKNISSIEQKEIIEIKELTLLFINERKKIFENYKLAIDLNSPNYNNVAENLILSADKYKEQIQIKLQEF